MPFDATKLRDPTAAENLELSSRFIVASRSPSFPPQPPERSEGPRRIRIEIEIIERRPNSAGAGLFGFVFWLLVLLLLAGLAHGQPTNWQSWQQGFITRYQSNDGWHGSSYRQGFMTYFDADGPNGEMKHCQSYELSGTVHTECW